MIVLLPVYMEFVGTPHGFWTAPLVLVYTLAIGLLMVSRVPTWSGKLIGRRIPRDLVLPLFVVVVLAGRVSRQLPLGDDDGLTLVYLASLPFSWNAFHRRVRGDRARRRKASISDVLRSLSARTRRSSGTSGKASRRARSARSGAARRHRGKQPTHVLEPRSSLEGELHLLGAGRGVFRMGRAMRPFRRSSVDRVQSRKRRLTFYYGLTHS